MSKPSDNPQANHSSSLLKHRKRRWRPLSSNPFVKVEPITVEGGETANLPALSHRPTELGDDQPSEKQDLTRGTPLEVPRSSERHDVAWERPPEWLDLLYDLAWTASFSSLTSNTEFKSPGDTVSYIAFFTAMWWIWTSQVFYAIDFYMDDWFHLICIFFHVIIFGLLATFTRGLDVFTYILHSPGSPTWESYDDDTITPELYAARRLTKKSFEFVAIVVAVSRVLLLVQHIIVNMYAKRTNRSARFPFRLLIVPCSLIISIGLFFAGFVVTMKHGEEPTGAKIKFVLWGTGLLVEMVAHIARLQLDIDGGLRLKLDGSIVPRFNSITTIIVGEGINAIAQTFYAVEKAPGFSRSMIVGIISSAIIIFFLVYLYFEGAVSMSQPVRRRAAWAMVHLPWLLSVILLLEGVKNQLLLSNFIYSANNVVKTNVDVLFSNSSDAEFKRAFGNTLLKNGMTFRDQVQNYHDMLTQNATAANTTVAELSDGTQEEIYGVWFLRLQMSSVLNTYSTFMEDAKIDDDVQEDIYRYQNDYAYTYQDLVSEGSSPMLSIIWELMKPSVDIARYILTWGGVTFFCLATLNLIQSWPRDRLQWISIITRYAIGTSMILLLLLNIGEYQEYFPPQGVPYSKRAAVFNWVEKNWVLPTLAIPYGLQFAIDTALAYIARRYEDADRSAIERADKSD